MKTIALIPARAGSKRIKDKNIVELDGIPLMAHSIIAAQACEMMTAESRIWILREGMVFFSCIDQKSLRETVLEIWRLLNNLW